MGAIAAVNANCGALAERRRLIREVLKLWRRPRFAARRIWLTCRESSHPHENDGRRENRRLRPVSRLSC